MRDLVYYVATSLDGFVAGPRGEVDDFVLDQRAQTDELALEDGCADQRAEVEGHPTPSSRRR